MNNTIIMSISSAISRVNEFLWGIPVLILMLGGGIYLSAKLKFPQIHIIGIFRDTLKTLFEKKSSSKELTQFQGFSTALAATVGTGSVAGVACALHQGGSGSIFWMWVSAFFGMCLSYCENFLAVKYSKLSHKGSGAVCYLEKAGKTRFLPCFYALCSVLASLGMGNMTQAGTVVSAANNGFAVPELVGALAVVVFCAFMVCKNTNSAKICEKLIPFCATLFIAGSMLILLCHPVSTANAFCEIFHNAFSVKACAGGTLGGLIVNVCIQGLKRGAFSNEAGLGSTCAVHTNCQIKSEELQGKWAMTEVFIDTMIICTLTALCIIVSKCDYSSTADGSSIVVSAYTFGLGKIGRLFTCLCLMLFALCTLTGWYYIGEKSFTYLFPKSRLAYGIIYIVCAYSGCVAAFEVVWGISDIFNGLMAIPNLAGVLILSKEIKAPKFRRLRDE